MLITEQQVNALFQYLARRPYGEVFKLISMLGSLQKETKEVKKEKKKS